MDRGWLGWGISLKCRLSFHEGQNHPEQLSNSSETDSDNDERDPGILDAEIAQLLNSDTEDEEFDGFVEEEWTEKVSVLFCILCVTTEQCWELLWMSWIKFDLYDCSVSLNAPYRPIYWYCAFKSEKYGT